MVKRRNKKEACKDLMSQRKLLIGESIRAIIEEHSRKLKEKKRPRLEPSERETLIRVGYAESYFEIWTNVTADFKRLLRKVPVLETEITVEEDSEYIYSWKLRMPLKYRSKTHFGIKKLRA